MRRLRPPARLAAAFALVLIGIAAAPAPADDDTTPEAARAQLATSIDDYFSALGNATFAEATEGRLTISAVIHPDARAAVLLDRIRAMSKIGRSPSEIVANLRLEEERKAWEKLESKTALVIEMRHSNEHANNTVDYFLSPMPNSIGLRCGKRPVRWLLAAAPEGLTFENVEVANFTTEGGRPSIGPLTPRGTRAAFRGRSASFTAVVDDDFVEWAAKQKNDVTYSVVSDNYDEFHGRSIEGEPLDLRSGGTLLRQQKIRLDGPLPQNWPLIPEAAQPIIDQVIAE